MDFLLFEINFCPIGCQKKFFGMIPCCRVLFRAFFRANFSSKHRCVNKIKKRMSWTEAQQAANDNREILRWPDYEQNTAQITYWSFVWKRVYWWYKVEGEGQGKRRERPRFAHWASSGTWRQRFAHCASSGTWGSLVGETLSYFSSLPLPFTLFFITITYWKK